MRRVSWRATLNTETGHVAWLPLQLHLAGTADTVLIGPLDPMTSPLADPSEFGPTSHIKDVVVGHMTSVYCTENGVMPIDSWTDLDT